MSQPCLDPGPKGQGGPGMRWEGNARRGTLAGGDLPGIVWPVGPLTRNTFPICSFGIVIWDILTQKKPYSGSRRQWDPQWGPGRGCRGAESSWGQGQCMVVLWGTLQGFPSTPIFFPPLLSRAHLTVRGGVNISPDQAFCSNSCAPPCTPHSHPAAENVREADCQETRITLVITLG